MAKILVVDDEEHIRLLYSEELKEEGYDVITAEGGHGLLGRIESDEPDLVVLDIKMVDYNGLDLLQDIRNKFYDLPVILSTAYDTFKEDMKSIAADFYVVKSFDLSAVSVENRLTVNLPPLPMITVAFPFRRRRTARNLNLSTWVLYVISY
jgi:DNA-binding NtrC family response regulator